MSSIGVRGSSSSGRLSRAWRDRWRLAGERMFRSAMEINLAEIRGSLSALPPAARILDLGCYDGATAERYLPGEGSVFGVEMFYEPAAQAAERSMRVVCADLNQPLPFEDESFDAVTSNQVIEHLYATDLFLQESYRILRPDGLLVVSTENLASWHNVAALLFGWQAFSLTNVTARVPGIGNPLANLRGGEPLSQGWEHLRVFSYRGLRELALIHGFVNVEILGAGYYPLPANVGRIDARHAAFIILVARRPTNPRRGR